MLAMLVVSLAAALALSLLALGTVWLRQSYGVLSEKHALAEAALRRRDRLSAMGELASTVAHEVRNPLNAIAMSAQRLRREFPAAVRHGLGRRAGGDDATAGRRRRRDAADRHASCSSSSSSPGRPASPRSRPTSAPKCRRSSRRCGRSRRAAGWRSRRTSDGAGTAVVDAGQLRQAVDNLLRNAIEATPAGGRVAVEATTGPRGHSIEVRDSGTGIAADDLPRIFDLYFTTKPHGTGVGLAVTQQIVAAHGGTIEVDSTPGGGTAMTMRLPLTAEGSAQCLNA